MFNVLLYVLSILSKMNPSSAKLGFGFGVAGWMFCLYDLGPTPDSSSMNYFGILISLIIIGSTYFAFTYDITKPYLTKKTIDWNTMKHTIGILIIALLIGGVITYLVSLINSTLAWISIFITVLAIIQSLRDIFKYNSLFDVAARQPNPRLKQQNVEQKKGDFLLSRLEQKSLADKLEHQERIMSTIFSCVVCGGTGRLPSNPHQPCRACRGTGLRQDLNLSGDA